MIVDLFQITFFYSLPFQTGEWIEITRDVLVDAARALSTVKEKGKTKKEGNIILRPGERSLIFRRIRYVIDDGRLTFDHWKYFYTRMG